MATSSMTITSSVAGGPSGTKVLGGTGGLVITNATSTDAISVTSLASGFNSIPIPTNAIGVVIIPPAGNSQTITLKGVTGDTGVGLHVTNPTILTFATAQTTFGLTLGGGVTMEMWYF